MQLPDVSGIERNLVLDVVRSLNAPRQGPRPTTRRVIPHRQLDQLPTPETVSYLLLRCADLPLVQIKQSRMAPEGSYALCLGDETAAGPQEAFIDAHEFCHIHPLPESGIHLMLPSPLRGETVRLGWGEPHPISLSGILTALTTVYVPRDRHEIEIVLYLIAQSRQFAQGGIEYRGRR